MYAEAAAIKKLVNSAERIVIIQADNPDADSLGSSLALEHILGDLGKQPYMYCGVDIPTYLRYLSGWDRVMRELPKQFDMSIVVDASTMTLLEKIQINGEVGWIAAKPTVVLDHHGTVDHKIDFAAVTLCDDHTSSTGELVFNLAGQLKWRINPEAAASLMTAILGDTQGLTNDLATADTYRVMAELTTLGVNRPLLEEQRREFNKMTIEIFKYKGRLIDRAEFVAGGRIANVMVPQDEINTYSPLYNPVPLIQGDMLMTSGIAIAIVFKEYSDGKVTAAIRGNAIADKIAAHMGGGGHPYASGFKITNGQPFNEIKAKCIAFATQLLDELDRAAPIA